MSNNCFLFRVSESSRKLKENNKQNPGLAPASESQRQPNEHWMPGKVKAMFTL